MANWDDQTSRKENNKENDVKWDSDKDHDEGKKNGELKNNNGDMKNKSNEVKKKRSDVKGADKTSETSGKHGRIPCDFIKGTNGVTCGEYRKHQKLAHSS